MKRSIIAGALVFALFLVLFLIGESWDAPLLANPTAQLRQPTPLTALAGVGLLLADAALPVPSSLVMIAHGAVFGVVLGTLLSVVGGTGAALIGFALGRGGGPLLNKLISPQERAMADRLLAHWGALAIVVTRPVPLLAETVTVLAGASTLSWVRAALAAVVGTLPVALIYALTGVAVVSFGNGALVFVVVLLLAGGMWLAGQAVERRIVRQRQQTITESSAS